MMSKKILILMIMLYLIQSCTMIKMAKSNKANQNKSNKQMVQDKVKEFLYKINKRKRLKKKRISYHVSDTREYKNILEQTIVEEQTSYGYIVINRSYISALDIEQDLNNQDDTLKGVDIIIIAKSENNSIILKALTIKNENLLTMDVIQLEKRKAKDIAITQSEKPLNYHNAFKYCKSKNKTLPNQYDVDSINVDGVLFWTKKRANNYDSGMVYDANENIFFEAMRADTFDVVCVSR